MYFFLFPFEIMWKISELFWIFMSSSCFFLKSLNSKWSEFGDFLSFLLTLTNGSLLTPRKLMSLRWATEDAALYLL